MFEYGARLVEIYQGLTPGPDIAVGSNNATGTSSRFAVVHLREDKPHPGNGRARNFAAISDGLKHTFEDAISVLSVNVALEIEAIGL